MSISIEILGNKGAVVPAQILGTNLEMFRDFQAAMLSERLTNPKFGGPEAEFTGVAYGWKPISFHYSAVNYKLVPGMGLTGGEAQLIQNYSETEQGAILQTGRVVKAGEKLEVEVWAMARHRPVTIEVSIAPLAVRKPHYARAAIAVDSAYWKKYTVELQSQYTDREAVFMVRLKDQGIVYFDQIRLRPADSGIVCEEGLEKIRSLQIPVLRFPGGCSAANYHWRFGTGPQHLRPSLPDPVNKFRIEYDFGIEEYLTMCRNLDIQPFITVNIGTGTPEEAGEWARYCAEWYQRQEMECPVIYFQMGNEQYGAWEISHMTADMYLGALQQFVPAVRSGYPNARIIVLGEQWSAGVAGQSRTALRETVLKHAKGLFDVIAIHRYMGQWFDDQEQQIWNVVRSVEQVTADLKKLIADCRAHHCAATVAITEWNYWMEASHWDNKGFFEPDDARHGLFYIGMIHNLARLVPDVEVATYYHLLNGMGMIRNDGGIVSETSIAELLRLYRPAFPGERLDLRVESPTLKSGGNNGEDNPFDQVDALGLRNGQGLWVYIMNRAISESAAVRLPNPDNEIISVRMMSAENNDAPFKEMSAPAVGKEVVIPPLSLIRIQYQV